MGDLCWTEVGTCYIAEVQHGKLVIAPTVPHNPRRPYTAHIETRSGKVVASAQYGLEACRAWAFIHLPLLDEVAGEWADCGRVVETLDLCQKLLSTTTDAVHWLRIEHIKAWIAESRPQPSAVAPVNMPTSTAPRLEWSDDGRESSAETPHGSAVIQKVRDASGAINYRASLVHRSGAELRCYAGSDMMEARRMIRKQLEALERAGISDVPRDILDFTLDVCRKILPSGTDPIHFARLKMLQTRLHFSFV